MPLPACYPTRLKFFTGIITDKVLFQKTVWQLRLEAVPPLCFHGVTLLFNSCELPRQNTGGQGLEPRSFENSGKWLVEPVRGWRAVRSGRARAKKMPFFCRLEIEILLR